MQKRRYEILLPLKYNDGQPVPPEFIKLTKEEILSRFDGLNMAPQAVVGVWKHEGQSYADELIKLVVDVEDSAENQFFFANLKTVLLERFQQVEIYMISFPIDRV
jgi:hypothetical protein